MSAAAEAGWIEIARSQKRDLPFKGPSSLRALSPSDKVGIGLAARSAFDF